MTTMLSCEIPSESGHLAGLNIRGTYSGAKRHERLGEKKCEECRTAYNAHKRAKRAADPEKDRARVREYWRKNPEKRRQNVQRFRESNPERWNEIMAKSRAKNAEKIRIKVKARKERLRHATPFKVDPAVVVGRIEYWGRKCWMCGGPYEHLDHVKPIAAGGLHIAANLRPACAKCNIAKKDKWPMRKRAS